MTGSKGLMGIVLLIERDGRKRNGIMVYALV